MILGPTNPDRATAHLVELARETLTDALTLREQAGLGRLEERLAEKPRRWRATIVVPSLAALIGFAIAVLIVYRRPLSFSVMNGTVTDGGYISATLRNDTTIRFSDGSEVQLAPDTRTRIAELDAHGARVMLESGSARVGIAPLHGAKWSVDAGPYTIRVTGTEFDVAWSGVTQVLDLRLHHGSVVVLGPLVSQGLVIETGQHLTADAKTGQVSLGRDLVDSTSQPEPEPSAVDPSSTELGAPASSPAAAEEPLASTTERGPKASRKRVEMGSKWAGLMGRGEFQAVLDDAERLGIETTLARANLFDLSALADAARYARRVELAKRAFEAERTRFARSRQAHEAAFFLGGLAEESQAPDALSWYERYLSESPEGVYKSQALGRKMMIVHKRRGAGAARPIASEYVARYPDGPYASSAKKLLEMP